MVVGLKFIIALQLNLYHAIIFSSFLLEKTDKIPVSFEIIYEWDDLVDIVTTEVFAVLIIFVIQNLEKWLVMKNSWKWMLMFWFQLQ